MPKSRSRKLPEDSGAPEEIDALKKALQDLRDDFHRRPEQELDKLLAEKRTQVRVGQVIGDSVLFGRKKT